MHSGKVADAYIHNIVAHVCMRIESPKSIDTKLIFAYGAEACLFCMYA
jgi:hypothetical protein